MSEKIERETKDFIFNVGERVAIIQMMPQKEDYETLKMWKWLNENLWFKQEQHKEINLRIITDDDGKQFYHWDDHVSIPDIAIELDVPTQNLLAVSLEKLNKDHLMGKEHFDLYEKFCIGK